MKVKMMMAVAALAYAFVADAWTKNCALLLVGTSAQDTARILKYDIHTDGWSYGGVFLNSFDGHCRVPTAVTVFGDKVYVADWCGYCKGKDDAPNRPTARILQYDLDGNYVRTVNGDVRTLHDGKVCRLESLVVSPDGKSLYATMAFFYSNGHLMKFSEETGERAWSVSGLSTPFAPWVTGDGKTLIVPQRNVGQKPAVYNVSGETPVLLDKTFNNAMNTVGAFLDEDRDELYLGGYQTKTKVFKYSNGEFLREICGTYDTMYRLVKVDGTIYTVEGTTIGKVRSLNADGTDANSTAMVDNLAKITQDGNATALVSIPRLIAPYTVTRTDSAVEIAHWKFDEVANAATFTNALDGMRFPIRARAVQSGATGVSGGALYFAGNKTLSTYAHGVIENSSKLLGASWGVFCWIGNNAGMFTSDSCLLSTRLGGDNLQRMSLGIGAKGPMIFNYALNQINFSGSEQLVNDGKWHHVGYVKNANELAIWVDGVKRATWTEKVKSFMHETEIDYRLGMSAEEYSQAFPTGTFLDELRVFDGAPTDAQIVAMYEELKAAAGDVPAAGPATPEYNDTVAGKYGTVVVHASAHQAALTAPDILTHVGETWYLTYSTDKARTSREAMSQCLKSTDGGSSWALQCKTFRETDVSLYAAGSAVSAFGRTVSVSGCYYNQIAPIQLYVNPTNGCMLRASYGAAAVSDGTRLGSYTNSVNLVSYRRYAEEPDLVNMQTVTPGAAVVADGSLHQAYLINGKIGLVSADVGADGALSDFRASVAEVPPVATTFAGPVVKNSSGDWVSYLAAYGASSNLPGMDRPFNLKYDARTECYWAAVTPNGRSVDLYVSRDLVDWKLAVSAVTLDGADEAVANAAFDFSADGKDLVLAFNLTAPDGGTAPRNLSEPNFVLLKTVARYRKYSPFRKGLVFIVR